MQNIPDDVLAKAGLGDRKAFEEIYRIVSGFVYSVALRITQSRPDAEEVTQDVFLKIHHKLKEFRMESSFKTWTYRITVNASLDLCRRSARHAAGILPVPEVPETAARPDAELSMKRNDAKATVNRLLGILNTEQRACIVLREIEGLSYEEIAQTMNTNINTVRSRLKRARQALMTRARQEPLRHELS